MDCNTVLCVDPRKLRTIPSVISEFHKHLGDTRWKYVFYCGKDTSTFWKDKVGSYVELRELNVTNLTPGEYSSLFKQPSFWKSLYGDFVLTIQDDAWIANIEPYTIDYFINLNKSYIGGNMNFRWGELEREHINLMCYNVNGGLSLRKRNDMFRICESFPDSTDAEDVFFTIGCIRLGLSLGDDEVSSHFAIHKIYKSAFFGIHNPERNIKLNLKTHKLLKHCHLL